METRATREQIENEIKERINILKSMGYEPEMVMQGGFFFQPLRPLFNELVLNNINGRVIPCGCILDPKEIQDGEEMLKQFKEDFKEDGAIPYLVISTPQAYNGCFDFFFVDTDVTTWTADKEELKNGVQYVYSKSGFTGGMYDGGRIGFTILAGGLVRKS